MNGLLGAIQFLTRVPVRTKTAVEHHRVVPWFSIVGGLIGIVVGAVAAGLSELVPIPVAAGLAIIVGLLITGAFHEDGLADIADAFGGGWTRQQRFEILKDSRHGTYGVAALTSSILLRMICVASISSPAAVFAGLVAAHTLARTAAVGVLVVAPPAARGGLGADTGRSLRPLPTVLGLISGIGVVGAVTGWWAGPLVVASLVGAGGVVGLAIRKIGGIAGDVLGGVEQVVECLVLVIVAGLAQHHAVWWA